MSQIGDYRLSYLILQSLGTLLQKLLESPSTYNELRGGSVLQSSVAVAPDMNGVLRALKV